MRENYIKDVEVGGETYIAYKSKCKHLKGNMCGIYDRRPETCKIFPSVTEKAIWKKINPKCGMV